MGIANYCIFIKHIYRREWRSVSVDYIYFMLRIFKSNSVRLLIIVNLKPNTAGSPMVRTPKNEVQRLINLGLMKKL